MPRVRKEAPEVQTEALVGDERTPLIREWDEREPEYRHKFKLLDTPARSLEKAGLEPVRDEDGKVVQDDYQMLCRQQKAVWEKRRSAPELRSKQICQSINADQGEPFIDDSFTKFRDPKVVPRKKE